MSDEENIDEQESNPFMKGLIGEQYRGQTGSGKPPEIDPDRFYVDEHGVLRPKPAQNKKGDD